MSWYQVKTGCATSRAPIRCWKKDKNLQPYVHIENYGLAIPFLDLHPRETFALESKETIQKRFHNSSNVWNNKTPENNPNIPTRALK